MATGFKNFLQGLRLFPKTSSTVSQAGDLDFDTSSNKLNLHNGTTSSPVTTEAHSATLTNKNLSDSTTFVTDVSDPTKRIKLDAAGTTGTTTTLLSSQTTDKTLTLPDATDTLVGKNTTDTLTNKTLTAPVMSDPTSTTFMEVSEIATPSTPASGKMRIYAKSDSKLYIKNDDGNETQVNTGAGGSVTSVSTTYTALTSDDVILASASGGSFTITLFTAVGNADKYLTIKKTDSSTNTVTIDGSGSETINGNLTRVLSTQNETIRIVSDGSNWHITNRQTLTSWIAYTPTVSGLGAGSGTVEGWYRRNGDSIDIYVGFVKDGTPGTGAVDVSFTLPTGLTASTQFQVGGQDINVGFAYTFSVEAVSQNATASVRLTSNELNVFNEGGAGNAYQGADFRAGSLAQVIVTGLPIIGWES